MTRIIRFPGTMTVPAGHPKFSLYDLTTDLLYRHDFTSLALADAAPVTNVPSTAGELAGASLNASTTAAPVYVANASNGNGAAKFTTASSTNIYSPSFAAPVGTPATRIFVVKLDAIPATGSLSLFSGSYIDAKHAHLAINVSASRTLTAGAGATGEMNLTAAGNINTGTWYRVAAVFDGANSRGYVDANPVVTGTTGATNPTHANQPRELIGSNSVGSGAFVSMQLMLSEMWGRALSEVDIRERFNQLAALIS